MAMQRYLVYLQPGKIDILNDKIKDDINRLYLLDYKKTESKYDFVIASAHDPNAFSYKRNGRLIVVVSHIPEMKNQDEAWAAFYINVCMADLIACDSFTRDAMQKLAIPPEKRYIILDGCTPANVKPPILSLQQKINIVSLDENQDFWRKFSSYVMGRDSEFTISPSISSNAVGIAFRPLSPTLSVNMAHKLYHIMAPYHESSIYLDTRCNHHLYSKFERLINMGGEAPSKPFKDAFEILLEDLSALLNHSANHPLIKFTSNVTIFDRIFHEINKTPD